MGLGDKIENSAEKAGGKGKQAACAAMGDERCWFTPIRH